MDFQSIDASFYAACCEHLMVKTTNPDLPNRHCLGFFDVYYDIEDEPLVTHGASVFINVKEKIFLYRTKFGNWVIGDTLGKMRRGAMYRSNEEDQDTVVHCCPCKIYNWEVLENGEWKNTNSVTVQIRRKKSILNF